MAGRTKAYRAAVFLCVLTIGVVMFSLTKTWINRAEVEPILLLQRFFWDLSPLVFVLPGALILSRQPRNMIGWLLMIPGLLIIVTAPLDAYLLRFQAPPETPSLFFLFVVWLSNWGWVLLIFPLLFIPVLFPTGRPLSPGWRWLIRFGLAMLAFFTVVATFAKEWGASGENEGAWTVRNPIGFLTEEWFSTYFIIPWTIALVGLAILSVASLFVRYRRAGETERQQIRWLLYAFAIFIVVYIPSGFLQGEIGKYLELLFVPSVLIIPLAIAIAITRYRLYDIDIIIRRTLVYGLLTFLLSGIYLGGVSILQTLLATASGQSSPASIVLSTLAIAALFNPLRGRLQEFIDRRFYRQKYNAEQTLVKFTAAARNETDLHELSALVLSVVRSSLQPEHISLWLMPERAHMALEETAKTGLDRAGMVRGGQ